MWSGFPLPPVSPFLRFFSPFVTRSSRRSPSRHVAPALDYRSLTIHGSPHYPIPATTIVHHRSFLPLLLPFTRLTVVHVSRKILEGIGEKN